MKKRNVFFFLSSFFLFCFRFFLFSRVNRFHVARRSFTRNARKLLATNLNEHNPVVRTVTSTSRSIVLLYVQPPFSRHRVLVCFDLHGSETFSIPRYRHAIFIR